LTALRAAGLILPRRDGRFIYYRLANPALVDLVRSAGRLESLELTPSTATAVCTCPNCADEKPGYIPLS
jgi:hypothetical protein